MIELIDDRRYWCFLEKTNLYFTRGNDTFKDIDYEYEVADLHRKKNANGCYELKIRHWLKNVTVDIMSCTWCSDDPTSEFGWTERRQACRLFNFSKEEWEQQDKFEVIRDSYFLFMDYFKDKIEIKEG